jgi:hypothetical protein
LDGRAAVLLLNPEADVPQRISVSDVVPFVAVVGGLAVSVWGFRSGDGIGGLAAGLLGVIPMIALAIVVPGRRGWA